MSQSSSIDRLPSDVREALHGWLRELAITQTEAMERTNALLDELAAQQPVGKRVERGFSESRDRNYDFFRIPTRFKTRNSPQFPTIRRNDSDMPLLRIKRSRALRQPGHRLHGCIASPRNLPWPAGLAKWRGAGRTGHETRVTRHGFPTHYFPRFPGISRPPPVKGPRAVRRSRSASRRTPKEPMLRKLTLYIAQTGNVLCCVDILGQTSRMDRMIRCCFLVPHAREGIGSGRRSTSQVARSNGSPAAAGALGDVCYGMTRTCRSAI